MIRAADSPCKIRPANRNTAVPGWRNYNEQGTKNIQYQANVCHLYSADAVSQATSYYDKNSGKIRQ